MIFDLSIFPSSGPCPTIYGAVDKTRTVDNITTDKHIIMKPKHIILGEVYTS